jgi:hypothetical protein
VSDGHRVATAKLVAESMAATEEAARSMLCTAGMEAAAAKFMEGPDRP